MMFTFNLTFAFNFDATDETEGHIIPLGHVSSI